METITSKINNANWTSAIQELHQQGYTVLPGMLDAASCQQLIEHYEQPTLFRKTISMERYRFGQGEYKYYQYPLPDLLQQIRQTIYPQLAPIANAWMKALTISRQYPATLEALHATCRQNGQHYPTVLILQYGAGGHNTLHQDLYGDVFFPIQLVMFLNETGKDYTGGEFVLTKQVPRAQSKAIVLAPRQGDFLLFTTNFRPVKGSKGYYRVNMKHGVSEIRSGRRYTLGIIFHDAQS